MPVTFACDIPVAAGACDTQVVPLLTSTLPLVPGATVCTALVPLPSSTALAESVVAPVPPLPTGSVPVTPVVSGKPVALVSVPEDGVPNAPPLTTADPAVPTFVPRAEAMPVPKPLTPVEIGRPVAFVSVAADGVPRFGVVNTGDVARATTVPMPVVE